MEAANYLGIPPWELEKVPVFWREHALAVLRVKLEVQNRRQGQQGQPGAPPGMIGG